jgi:hypothetical protein
MTTKIHIGQETSRAFFSKLVCASMATMMLCRCAVDFGPMANRSKAQALSFTPPAGQSGIYVIRGGGIVGAAAYWTVNLDGDLFGKLAMRNYVYGTVAPGEHNLSVIYQDNGYTFRTEPDKNYFYVMKVSFTGHVEQISEDEGRQFVLSLSR